MASPRNFKRIISGDSHVMEPVDLWWNALGSKFGDRTPRVIHEYKGVKQELFYHGSKNAQVRVMGFHDDPAVAEADDRGFYDAGHDPEVRVRFQEQAGVEAEVLNTTYMLQIQQNPDFEVAKACAQVFNDWLADFASYDPKRLIGVSVIPMDDGKWAAGELERTTKRGLKSPMIQVQAPEGSLPYRDPAYDRFWAVAQEAGVPITLHSFTGRRSPLSRVLIEAQPPEVRGQGPSMFVEAFNEIQIVLANDFIFGGILDRFPELKIICAEWEVSWVPSFMGRVDQYMDISPGSNMPNLKMRPSDYVRNHCWHGIIDDQYAQLIISTVGVDRVMWGSDFPHVRSIGLGVEEAVNVLLDTLSPDDREKIVSENTAEIFNLN